MLVVSSSGEARAASRTSGQCTDDFNLQWQVRPGVHRLHRGPTTKVQGARIPRLHRPASGSRKLPDLRKAETKRLSPLTLCLSQWSRFSGGDGAPYWTLLACGLDPENFTKTSASYIQCEWPTPDAPDPASYPDMIWATNYSHLACQTLFTMWFAGRDYAPKCVINGVNIQDFLQSHFFDAMRQLGNAVRDAGDLLDDCVIGWDSMNEPNAGFLGTENLAEYGKETVLRVGPMPKPFEGLRLGMGEAVEVENYKFGSLGPKRDGSVTIDPQGKRAWLNAEAECNGSPYGWVRGPDWELGTCIWAQHGVWDPETSELLQPDYFDIYRGDKSASRPIEFGADYWLQHWRAWAPVVRGFHPEAIHFIHPPVFQVPPKIDGPEIADRAAFSSHFYDGLTLVTKHWVRLLNYFTLSRSLTHPLSSAELVQRRRTRHPSRVRAKCRRPTRLHG